MVDKMWYATTTPNITLAKFSVPYSFRKYLGHSLMLQRWAIRAALPAIALRITSCVCSSIRTTGCDRGAYPIDKPKFWINPTFRWADWTRVMYFEQWPSFHESVSKCSSPVLYCCSSCVGESALVIGDFCRLCMQGLCGSSLRDQGEFALR